MRSQVSRFMSSIAFKNTLLQFITYLAFLSPKSEPSQFIEEVPILRPERDVPFRLGSIATMSFRTGRVPSESHSEGTSIPPATTCHSIRICCKFLLSGSLADGGTCGVIFLIDTPIEQVCLIASSYKSPAFPTISSQIVVRNEVGRSTPRVRQYETS